jgi:2,4-dienoyl-CoA reductase-like NADH-dependent reductase (Old Yellow Enzyme family)
LTEYPTLFSPTEIGGVTLRNRIAHAAILTRYFRDHRPTEQLLNYYRSRARGGAAMIVTEPLAMTSVNRNSYKLRVWDEEGFDDLQRVAEVVRSEGAHILGQVQDPGAVATRWAQRQGRRRLGAAGRPELDRAAGAGSRRDSRACRRVGKGLRSPAVAPASAGVEMSSGHGHLFHQFLSPWSNRREDEYGGDLEGRTRFLRELIDAIRAECGRPFIIGLKLPADDGVPNSI